MLSDKHCENSTPGGAIIFIMAAGRRESWNWRETAEFESRKTRSDVGTKTSGDVTMATTNEFGPDSGGRIKVLISLK